MAEYLSPAVFIEELSSGSKPIQAVSTSVAGFVGHAPRGPLGVATAIDNVAQFQRVFGDPFDAGYLAFAVKAFFDEGGSTCWVVRTSHYGTPGVPDAKASTLTFQNAVPANALTVSASSPGLWGDTLSIEITHTAPDLFTLIVRLAGVLAETLDNLTMDPLAPGYAPAAVEQRSALIRAKDETPAASVLTPAQRRPAPVTAQPLTGGADGLAGMVPGDYIGTSAFGNGLHALDAIDDVNVIAVPEDVDRQVHVEGMAYCEQRADCFYVADAPEAAVTAIGVLNFKQALGNHAGGNAMSSSYGALYAPWIDVLDTRTGGKVRIPPSGAVIGRYARTDRLRGVHKAPAGVVDGRLAGALGLAASFSVADQEKLNPKGINLIREFPGVGSTIWGTRTVSIDPEWRYLNVRRLFLFLEESIEESTGWVVFEPNDRTLWKSIVRNVSAFLRLQWREGKLVGLTEEQAFYVKCDDETNPPDSVKLGRVITEIGVAPSRPAEFVIFRIEQFEGGSAVEE